MLLCTAGRLPHGRVSATPFGFPGQSIVTRLAPFESHMPVTLRRSVAIPVQALAWLGGQGTRAIAALVFIGIAVPPIGELLRPFVTEAIFLLLCAWMSGGCMITCGGRALFSQRPRGRRSECR